MHATSHLSAFRRTFHRGRIIRSVSERIGLVYFGTVNPRSDDHDSIRGITVSTKHMDRHFAVGAYDGYDISLADRTYQPLHSDTKHTWCVLQVQLQTAQLPYMLITPNIHTKEFEGVISLNRTILSIPLTSYPHEFSSRYSIYMSSHDAHTVETVLPAKLAHESAVRLWPYAVEIHKNKMYFYITEHRLTETVLGSAIESALWLADYFDTQSN